MKSLYAERVIGKVRIDFEVTDDLQMLFKSESKFTDVPTAVLQMGFSGQDGIDKAQAITHEVAIGTAIEGKLGIKREDVEKGVKPASPSNPQEIRDAQEKKAPRPANQVQKEVVEPTKEQEQEIQDFAQDEEDRPDYEKGN